MTLKRLVRVVAVGTLLGITGQMLAQTSTMETRQGSRHAGPGAVAASASTFAVGITRDNGATFVSTASVSDTVEIRGEVRPEPADIGLPADIFVVDRVIDDNGGHVSFSMRTAGVWQDWNGTVSLLEPFQEGVALQAAHPVTMFTGTLSKEGNHRIFLGYMAPDGILRYHTSGLPVTITAASTQDPLAEASVYFEANIQAGIVPYCLDCHVEGGSAPQLGALHTFVTGSSQASIDTNFNQFRALFNARGKTHILAKARGELAHVGGSILPSSSQEYRNLETFLDLLANI